MLTGPVTGAETAAERLVAAVATLGLPASTALPDRASDRRPHRRRGAAPRALSLTAARRVGAGTVIRTASPTDPGQPQSLHRGGDPLVARGQRQTDVLRAGRAVEDARRRDDAQAGEPVDRRPAVLVAGPHR